MKYRQLACVLAVMAMATAGCQKESAGKKPGASSGGKLRIGVMPKLVGIPFFNAVEKGAKEAAAELGVALSYDGPVENSAEQQAKMLQTWIAKKFDVIAIAPNDPDQIANTLKMARKRGIETIAFDADAAKEARAFFVNQATYEAIAKSLMDIMAKNIGPEGKYIYLTGSLTAYNQNVWMREMEKYRKKTYPKMVNLSKDPKPSGEDQALGTRVTLDILKSYPDVRGIFGMTSQALPGAAEAVRKQKAADKVFVTGLATPNTMRSYVKDGTVKEFVLWSPVDLGYLTVHAAKLLAEGKLEDGTIQAGRLGTIKVIGDQVLLGDPIVFNKDNIDKYDF